MKDNRNENPFDDKDDITDAVIRASLKLADQPAPELNRRLKTALYQREAAMQSQPAIHTFRLWYLPMILNLAVFVMLAAAALTFISSLYLSYFAAGVCIYAGLAGIVLTIAGVKRTNLKEEIAIRIKKRGALA